MPQQQGECRDRCRRDSLARIGPTMTKRAAPLEGQVVASGTRLRTSSARLVISSRRCAAVVAMYCRTRHRSLGQVGAARLILIEGMIGSGKTTTAMRVGDWLACRGEQARVFCECAAGHPIRTRAEDRLRAAACRSPPGRRAARRAAGPRAAPACTRPVSGAGAAERCLCGREYNHLGKQLPAKLRHAGLHRRCARAHGQSDLHHDPAAGRTRRTASGISAAGRYRRGDRAHPSHPGEPWSSRNVAFVENSPWARRRNLRGQDAVVKLYQAWEPVVTQLYSRYPFPKIMVTDPQHDWQATLTRICATARPSPARRKTQT